MNSSQEKQNIILIRPRIYLGDNLSIGPGKIELLKQINIMKSISGAARVLSIPYKKAWSLIDVLNQGFGGQVIETSIGGKAGGSARLTPLGQKIIDSYEALEKKLNKSAKKELDAFYSLLNIS